MLWRALKGQLHTMRMQACHASGRRARRSRSSCVSSHSCARSEPAHPGPVRRLWGVAAPVWGGAPRGVDDLHGKGVRDRYEGCRSTGRGLADGRWGWAGAPWVGGRQPGCTIGFGGRAESVVGAGRIRYVSVRGRSRTRGGGKEGWSFRISARGISPTARDSQRCSGCTPAPAPPVVAPARSDLIPSQRRWDCPRSRLSLA